MQNDKYDNTTRVYANDKPAPFPDTFTGYGDGAATIDISETEDGDDQVVELSISISIGPGSTISAWAAAGKETRKGISFGDDDETFVSLGFRLRNGSDCHSGILAEALIAAGAAMLELTPGYGPTVSLWPDGALVITPAGREG